MERLRFLARMRSDEVDRIAIEAAHTLLAAGGSAEVVVACRRLLDRHPGAGPLWWVTSTALTAADAGTALLEAISVLDSDPTAALLDSKASLEPDVVTLQASAVGAAVLGPIADVERAYDALARGRAVVVGVGEYRSLPEPVWEAALTRLERLPRPQVARLEWDDVTAVIAPEGPMTPEAVRSRRSCPVAPELLRPGL